MAAAFTASVLPPKKPLRACAWRSEIRAGKSFSGLMTITASSSSRIADARSPAMFPAMDAMHSACDRNSGSLNSRAVPTARSSTGRAAVGSALRTARKPRRKYAQNCASGLPLPHASRSSSQRTPSVVARVIQYQPTEVARSSPFSESRRDRHRPSTARMLSISRSIHWSHSKSRYRLSSTDCRHLDR